MLSLMPFTPRYAIFYAIYPKLCYRLCHIPRSSAIFFLNVMLQYITLTPSYANSSYAMFSGQSRGRISGYCCTLLFHQHDELFDQIFCPCQFYLQDYLQELEHFLQEYIYHTCSNFITMVVTRTNSNFSKNHVQNLKNGLKFVFIIGHPHWAKWTLIPFLIWRTFNHSRRWEMIKEFQIQAKN